VSLSAGSRLGPYEIVSPLGAGGMGEVYRAKDPRLGREVAVKVLPASFSTDADRLRRFEQEARAAGLLNHPNITAVYDIGTHDGAPYACSFLPGCVMIPLWNHNKESSQWPPSQSRTCPRSSTAS
jgi:serine/threonine protein kinase